jgi:hypothetical protein
MAVHSRLKDSDALEDICDLEHIPLAVVKLGDETTMVVTKTIKSPTETPAFFRIDETCFPSLRALQACDVPLGGTEVRAHATDSDSEGAPLFLAPGDGSFTVA